MGLGGQSVPHTPSRLLRSEHISPSPLRLPLCLSSTGPVPADEVPCGPPHPRSWPPSVQANVTAPCSCVACGPQPRGATAAPQTWPADGLFPSSAGTRKSAWTQLGGSPRWGGWATKPGWPAWVLGHWGQPHPKVPRQAMMAPTSQHTRSPAQTSTATPALTLTPDMSPSWALERATTSWDSVQPCSPPKASDPLLDTITGGHWVYLAFRAVGWPH